MNENILFVENGASYAINDTGVLVGFCRNYTDSLVAIIRNTSGQYITAPLTDFEYNGETPSDGD